MEDLSISGPGSPVSLKKFLHKNPDVKPITLIVDGSGCGITHDEENMLYVTPEECSKQSIYYSKSLFNGEQISAYLYRYISFLMLEKGNDMKYKTDQELAQAFYDEKITRTSEDYIYIRNFITYCENNSEAQQVIGLIQIIAGSLNIARKEKKGIRLYLDRPETALHPSRQSRFMSALMMLRTEYGFEEEVSTEN